MPRREPWAATLSVLLSVASGATDALSYLRLGGVFASVVTGNLILLGVSAGKHDGTLALHAGVSFLGYILGSAVGAEMCETDSPKALKAQLQAACLGLELALSIVLLVVYVLASGKPSGDLQLELVGLAALLMGLQSSIARSLPLVQSPTTYMTGALTSIVAGIVRGDRLGEHRQVLVALLSIAVGAGICTTLVLYAPLFAPVAAVVALSLSFLLTTIARPSRRQIELVEAPDTHGTQAG